MEDFWSPLQQRIKGICLNFDKKWRVRNRKIDTTFLVLFILKLVMSKNRQGYKSLLNELWEKTELGAVGQTPVSASSLCEARQKLPEEIFIELNKGILSPLDAIASEKTWCGHRIFAADGSKINLPQELLSSGYETPNKETYYPQGLVSILYALGSRHVHDCLLSSGKNERTCLIKQMDTLSSGDILVLDRGYFSYLLLYQARERNIHLICRLQSGAMNKAVERFWKSDLNDTTIDYIASTSVKSQIRKQGYDINDKAIKLRLIKYKINDEVYVCATTLIGNKYALNEFPFVYHGRWGIEELYKISKRFIDVEDFHSKTERGVKQELYAHVLLINIARLFEIQASKQLPPPPPPTSNEKDEESDHEYKGSHWQGLFKDIEKLKINFKNCLLVITRFIEKLIMSGEEKKEDWLSKMLQSITRVRQRIRPNRFFPRCSRKPCNKWISSNATKLKAA